LNRSLSFPLLPIEKPLNVGIANATAFYKIPRINDLKRIPLFQSAVFAYSGSFCLPYRVILSLFGYFIPFVADFLPLTDLAQVLLYINRESSQSKLIKI
jgi:hypothetical protein